MQYIDLSVEKERIRLVFQKCFFGRRVISVKIGTLACGVALAVASASFIVGCFTTVWDGDEAHHTRMSLGFYTAGVRVAHTPTTTRKDVPWDQFYYSDVLWPLLLSKLWLLTGRPSHILAQLYQTIWLFAFLIGLYRLSCLYYDSWVSLIAMVLTISIPMVPAYGTLFLLNIPVMALTTWAIYAAHRLKKWRWVFLLGLLMGGIYLTKRLNVAFYPGILLIGLVSTREKWQIRLTKLLVATAIVAAIITIDIDYRVKHFESQTLIKHKTPQAFSPDNWVAFTNNYYNRQSLLYWKDALCHIGPMLPFALLLYVLYRRYEWKDMIFLGLAASYASAFIGFLLLKNMPFQAWPIYYLPTFTLMTIPIAKGLKRLWLWRSGRMALLFCGILVFVQLIMIFQVLYKRRQLPADTAEAYKYICKSIPNDGKYFLCNGFGLELHTGRISTIRSIIPRVFFQPNTSWETRLNVLNELNIGYVVCRGSCVYDDWESQIIWDASAGMPKSFFEGLERLPNYEQIFKNKSITIWKVVASEQTLMVQ